LNSQVSRLPLILAAFICVRASAAPAPPPDLVVVVVIDTLRADHLPIYGYTRNTTPQMSKLWTDVVVFDQAYAASAATQPSVASLLTGRRPSVHGLWNVTQPRILQPNLAYWANVHGFYSIGVNANPNTAYYNASFDAWWAEQPPAAFYPAATVLDRARAMLNARPKDSKVFLYLQLADPHIPYNPPVYEKSFFVNDPIGSHFQPRFSGLSFVNANAVTPPVLRNMINRYDAAIHYMDSHLAPFLSELMRMFPNYFIIFTADHGEAFLEHGSDAGHARAMYDTVIRVPLIVMDSALNAQPLRRSSALISGLDIFTTVADRVTGYPVTIPTDGKSFLCAIDGRCETQTTTILSEMPYPSDDGRRESGCWGVAHIFQPRWGEASGTTARLTTVGTTCDALKNSIIHRNAWYDVSSDHLQRSRLRPREARASVVTPIMEAAWPMPKPIFTSTRKLSEEEIRRLRALGYVQ
jgi:arylsulfatase A-like enzyme